jgi:hypothetical protein
VKEEENVSFLAYFPKVKEAYFGAYSVCKYMLKFYGDYSQSDVEEYMSRNGITDLLNVGGSSSSSSGTTTSPSSNEFNYSSDNIHSGQNKVNCSVPHPKISA